ncbi:metallophosphoesterase family protein [Haloglomus litoreum]|uniref:metallophosphoesterase family protein n=1 Tax=Haloglomus litoreum TaxID=3034026 RepID=UPI0023E84F72|nr:metallophosphoesterase [Haloglomus sp. DT116]
MERRTFLRTVGASAGALAGAGGAGSAAANGDGEAEQNPTPVDGSEAYAPKVNEIRSPLSGVPEVVEAGETLRVELDANAGPFGMVEARLEPSFGGSAEIGLDGGEPLDGATSRIWNSDAEVEGSEAHDDEGQYEQVVVFEFEVPSLDSSPAFTPDLYDLVVTWEASVTSPTGGEDRQPRAVSVRESIPETLDVAVIADPQIGDPRALQSGFTEAQDEQSPEPFVQRARRVFGDRPDNRWAATRRAIAEVNALDPDIVLMAGDLCLGQDVPGKFYAEFEDAWDVMNRVQAPTFITCGNHDAYVQSGTDGKALYRETFGPPSYSVAIGDVAQVVAVDTFDWSYLDRLGASAAVSTYGGQVRDAQLAWLREELGRVADTDRSVLAVGHHNPSWVPDPKNRAYDETDGEPGAEQFARGARIVDSGQRWTGENAFALRRLFDETGVDAFFCGHSHQDRVARSLANWKDAPEDAYVDVYTAGNPADIVAALNSPDAPPELGSHYARQTYESTGGETTDRVENYPNPSVERAAPGTADAADLIADIHDTSKGTLYVNVASTMSSTGEYWGYRQFDYDTTAGGLDPQRFRYPVSPGFLDVRAVNPGRWDASQDAVGLYSTPSYLLGVTDEGSANSPNGRTVTVSNEQTVAREGAVTVSTTAENPTVEGGTVVWRRDADPQTDIKVAFTVPPGEETSFTVTGESPGQGGGQGR